jgi:hypothetical protein
MGDKAETSFDNTPSGQEYVQPRDTGIYVGVPQIPLCISDSDRSLQSP